jgi:hypothetical protein
MEKIVRLDESDIERLVKKIIKEDKNSEIPSTLVNTVKDIGGGDVSGYYASGDFVSDVILSLPNDVADMVKNSPKLKKYITDYFWNNNPSSDTYE